MKLEQQVCSLDLAKRLTELGVQQESLFMWEEGGNRPGTTPYTQIIPSKSPAIPGGGDSPWNYYAAFTVAELGEMLPTLCRSEKWNGTGEWNVHLKPHAHTKAETEADARAKMLCYLLENNLITASTLSV